MSKIKMRCTTCGKWFQSSSAKEVTCPECTQKARKDKLAAKAAPPTPTNPTASGSPARNVPPPPKPKATGGTTHWIDNVSDVKVSQPEQPPRPRSSSYPAPRDNRGGQGQDRGFSGPRPQSGGYRGSGGYRDNEYRTPYRVGGGMGLPDTTTPPRPRQPMEPDSRRPPRPGVPGEGRPERPYPGKPMGPRGRAPKAPRPPAAPRPKREKIPPPLPFQPSEEQVVQIEARYLELAVPNEFDGIRTQISKELSIPKSAVKKAVKALRDKMSMPSWWEVQAYTGTSEELEKIKAVYEPHMPVPAVGVHKQIAEELSLKPGTVYQAIKQIRLDMNLPQFNDPTVHGEEFVEQLNQKRKAAEEKAAEAAAKAKVAAEAASEESAQAAAASAAEPFAADEPKSDAPVAPTTESQGALITSSPERVQPLQAEQEPSASIELAERETGLSFEKTGDMTEIVEASEPAAE
ncbi:MAG TPA: hypothetical protein VNE61_10485 [Ktedonobacteraceae bacterium]|nr:hypothetical protein [Ktedonobacteraceae bacterium]